VPKPTPSIYFIACLESCGLHSAKTRSNSCAGNFRAPAFQSIGALLLAQSKPQWPESVLDAEGYRREIIRTPDDPLHTEGSAFWGRDSGAVSRSLRPQCPNMIAATDDCF
jgi:hypothetical protein